MKTGITVSKTRNRLATVATVTGAVAVIALSAAFMTVDFNDFFFSSAFTIDSAAVEALEPIRSDAMSEQNNIGEPSDDGGNNSDGSGGASNDNDPSENNYSDHGLPCLDPDCPIHHGNNDVNTEHETPCGDPDCPICNHETPCDDPNCTICHPDDKPPVDISMESIRFKPDSCEYVDEAAAQAVLSEYIESINHYFEIYPDGKIYLVGCIAKTARWSLTETGLSQKRADAVRQSLIDLGIDESKIVSIGIGINDPWRSDEWSNGYFDEETAKTNRRVWIIPDQYSEQVDLVIAIDDMLDDMKEAE